MGPGPENQNAENGFNVCEIVNDARKMGLLGLGLDEQDPINSSNNSTSNSNSDVYMNQLQQTGGLRWTPNPKYHRGGWDYEGHDKINPGESVRDKIRQIESRKGYGSLHDVGMAMMQDSEGGGPGGGPLGKFNFEKNNLYGIPNLVSIENQLDSANNTLYSSDSADYNNDGGANGSSKLRSKINRTNSDSGEDSDINAIMDFKLEEQKHLWKSTRDLIKEKTEKPKKHPSYMDSSNVVHPQLSATLVGRVIPEQLVDTHNDMANSTSDIVSEPRSLIKGRIMTDTGTFRGTIDPLYGNRLTKGRFTPGVVVE